MFLQILLQAVSGAASLELSTLLEKFRTLNGDDAHDKLVAAMYNSFTLLKTVTDQTKTKVDDTLVGIILNALPPTK